MEETIVFHELVRKVQDYEWSEMEHEVSLVNFDLENHGMWHLGLSARILQPLGACCSIAPLEISHPTNYDGMLDFEAFREAATDYYRAACREGVSGEHESWRREVAYRLHSE